MKILTSLFLVLIYAFAFSQSRYEKAIAIYESSPDEVISMLSKQDLSAKEHYLLGYIYYQKDEWAKSLPHYLYAATMYEDLQDQKGQIKAINAGAKASYQAKSYQYAKSLYQKVHSIQPSARSLYNLGVSYQRLLKFDSAAYYLSQSKNRAIQQQDTARLFKSLIEIGHTFHYADLYDEAKKAYQEVEGLATRILENTESSQIHKKLATKNLFHSYNNIGNTLHDSGQYLEAIAWLQKSLSIDSSFAPLLNLAECYKETGSIEKAIQTFDLAIQSANTTTSKSDYISALDQALRLNIATDNRIGIQKYALELAVQSKKSAEQTSQMIKVVDALEIQNQIDLMDRKDQMARDRRKQLIVFSLLLVLFTIITTAMIIHRVALKKNRKIIKEVLDNMKML